MTGKLRIIVEIQKRDGWMEAVMMIDGERNELCRMVSPPPHAVLRVEILDAFQKLASTIVESIIRENEADAEITVKSFNLPKAGHS